MDIFYILIQIYKKLPYNVCGAINKKPHECGGRLDNQVGDIPKYVLLLSEITLLRL